MERIPPKGERHCSLGKEDKACFNNVLVFPFNYTMLMVSMKTAVSKGYSFLLKIVFKAAPIFTPLNLIEDFL